MMNHPSKEGGLFVSAPIQNIFDICNFFHNIIWISHIKMLYLYQMRFDWENSSPIETD